MNDMILNLLANDSFTVSDFRAVGLTAENTKLESEEKYKQSQMIQDNQLFHDEEGNFSDAKFHEYYLQATEFYNHLADETYLEDITKNTFYSKDNIFAPNGSPTIDELPRFVVSPNPFLQNNSLTRVGKKGDRTLSISEIAQSQQIYDSEKGEFREESVNDRAAGNNVFKWLGDLFSEPLVIAQWDEDGEHIDPLTGVVKQHKKGDYKYNDDGTFYYETLNGRDVYGRQVLNRMNTLTVDGSKANRYDFFDSDDLEQKSFIGNVMKNLALVGSMFLPVVGKPIIAASIATQSVGLLGALGKMFLGSENETVNNLHAWSKTVNRQSATEYASQNTWCWENLINMIGDTVGQLAEQRFLFTHVPALLKGTKGIKAGNDTKTYNELLEQGAKEIREKTNKDLVKAMSSIKAGPKAQQEAAELAQQWKVMSELKSQAALEKYMESYRKLGSVMSKAYMTGITVQDTYGEAKANGASDMEALALTLGYAAGEAWILNTGLGEWIMPELQGEKLKYRSIINALKKEVKPITEDVAEAATKEGRQNIFKKIFNIGKRIATDDYARQQFASSTYNPMMVVLAHATGEGFEEVSEELLADVSKSAFNVVNWLRGDETRMSGAWENIGDRYGMSLLGGFVGGGISSAGTDFSQARQLAKMTKETAMQEIVYMINNDKIGDFKKFYRKADIGNKHLSFDTDENGNFKPGTKENNQDKEIKDILDLQLKVVEDTINAEGAKFSENSLFDALTLKDLRYLQLRNTATVGAFFQEYNSLITQIVQKQKEIRELTGEDRNTDTKTKELTPEQAGEVAKKKQELNDLRVRKDAFTSGKRAPEFIATALYEAQQALHSHKRGYTFEGWVKAQKGKTVDEIPNEELKELREKYKAYRETEMKNDVIGDARQFVDLVGMASGAITQQQEYIKAILEEGKQDAFRVQTYLGNMFDGINAMYDDENFDIDTFVQDVQNQLTSSVSDTTEVFAKPFLDNDIIARLNYIADTPETEHYTKKEKDLDKTYTIFEAFANYSDIITKKFIEQGYIHPEVKNHLVQTYQQVIATLRKGASAENNLINDQQYDLLKHLSVYFGDQDSAELAEDIDRGSMLNAYADNLERKIEEIQALSHTPIVQLLENFKVATSTTKTSVRDVIDYVNTLINQGRADISAFGFGEDVEKQLQEVDELIDVLASALYATRVDEAGVNNAWGYSKTLNELNKKYGNDQWVELAEIEGVTADLIQQDLAILKQKVRFARNLNSVNNGQKLNRQNKVGYNKQYLFTSRLKRFVDSARDKLPEWDFTSLVNALRDDLLLLRYNKTADHDKNFSLTPDEKIQIERESLMLDDAVYQFFQDNISKVTDVDALSKLIHTDFFDLYDPATGLLNDETESLDDNQFIFSLAAKAAVKGSDFYNALRKTFNDEKAPVPMQEQATWLNVAMVANGDVVNNFAKAYAKSVFANFKHMSDEQRRIALTRLGKGAAEIDTYNNNPDLFLNDHTVEKFANIVLTEGIAGSGKTGGVFDMTVRVLQQINPDLVKNAWVVNSTLANAQKLAKDLHLEGKTFSSSHKETEHDLIRYFYSDYTPDYTGKVTLVGNKIQTNFTLKENLKDLPKVIFIDEASRYDYIQMRLLSEAAQHYGIAVLAAGDFDQISAESSVKIGDQQFEFRPNRLNFIRSPKLGLSFRTLNSQMSKNQKEVLANLHDEDKTDFNIFYWENDEEIRGFKVHENSDLDGIVASINKIKKSLSEGEKIGFLYADETRSIHKQLQEKFGDLLDVRSIRDAQGLEGNYYIIDLNQDDSKSKQEIRNEVYTAVTRAKQGGVVINNRSNPALTITNTQEESSELESITPEAIKKSTQKRREIFEEIFKDAADVNIPYISLTPIKRETPIVPPKPDDIIPPDVLPPDPTPIPTGMYKTREEAEKVDLSAFTEGLELYSNDGSLFGVITGTDVYEQEVDNVKYYAPVVLVQTSDGTITGVFAEELLKYTLKNPTNNEIIPKYKVGNIFYDGEGNTFEIVEVITGDKVTYKVKEKDGTIKTLLETDLESYSTIPPVNLNPSIETDLGENLDPEAYRRQIEGSNGETFIPPIESDGTINHWMYTFNGYETGVLWSSDGYMLPDHFDPDTPVGKRTAARIDNVNGLLNLGIVGSTASKQECLSKIADMHSILMYDRDNASVITRINKLINPTNDASIPSAATIQYGIKSSARPKSGVYGTKDSDVGWYVFDKHRNERSEFAQESVEYGDALSYKDIVAVFRDSSGKKILEITLGVLNSPITIGSMRDENGEYLYKGVGEVLEQLKPGLDSEVVFNILTKASEVCKTKGYIDLENLFKAYLFTSNGFAPFKAGFNLASSTNTGPQVIVKKGDYQKDETRQYSTQYVDLNQFVTDPRIVVSDIFIPKSDSYGGRRHPIHKGYPGVFVTYNKDYKKEDLAFIYLKQLDPNYTGPKDVQFYYVIPPEATAREYLRNYRNAYLNKIDGGSRHVQSIGNMWTSYKILKNIHEGSELTEDKLKSMLLDHIELSDVIDYINQLNAIEQRSNWEGDVEYESVLAQYKQAGYSENNIKQFALRTTVLQKQMKILQSNFKETSTPVHKIFTLYLANAAYTSKNPSETPKESVLALVDKYNPSTIKYKVTYSGDMTKTVGIFIPAKVNPHDGYTLQAVATDGSIITKGFQINSKIDPPIFTIDALKEAVAILAGWKYEDANNTGSRKIMAKALNDGTHGYLRDSISTRNPKNNFEKLKDNNKILFGNTGLFKDIEVRGADDPNLDQIHFAEEILTKFNSEPNHLGFAVVDASGKVKMYAFEINKLPGSVSRNEMETTQSLGGITIGKALIFKTVNDVLQFSSANRDYTVTINGNTINLQHYTKEIQSNPIPVVFSSGDVITKDVLQKAIEFVENSSEITKRRIKDTFRSLNYDELISDPQEEWVDWEEFDSEFIDKDPNLKALYRFLTFGPTTSVNLKIGDMVSVGSNSNVSLPVVAINGSVITLDNGMTLDVTTDSIFKAKDQTIECPKTITISYGQ